MDLAIIVPVDAPEGRLPGAAVLALVAVVPLLGSSLWEYKWGSRRAQSSRNPEC